MISSANVNIFKKEWAATLIQSRFRGFTARCKFFKIKLATTVLQTVTRVWLAVAPISKSINVKVACLVGQPSSDVFDRYLKYMIERHMFVKLKKSVLLIQSMVRTWIMQRHYKDYQIAATILQSYIRGQIGRSRCILLGQLQTQHRKDSEIAATILQSYIRGHIWRSRCIFLTLLQEQHTIFDAKEVIKCRHSAATKIQLAWRTANMGNFYLHRRTAAVKIQSHWRGWYMRKKFFTEIGAFIKIQAGIRCLIYQNAFKRYRLAAIEIQRFIRGHNARNCLLGSSYFRSGRPPFGSYHMINNRQSEHTQLMIVMNSILKLQRWWKQIFLHRSRTKSLILIQSFIRGFSARRAANRKKNSIVIIQRWWRNRLFLKSVERSVLIIQAHFRGWIVRRAARRDKLSITVIQSHWKGWLVRKASKQQVSDLRYRLNKSAANVDDGRRLINRLVAALSELLGCRSITNIRHTCATLNMATEHSQKCCETLVDAGAIDVLLKQFRSLNRGVPEQEVLKHVLCTLRNIIRFPHLLLVLINTSRSLEIIFQELLRNKGEGFFIACDILKKLCSTQEGFDAISRLSGHIRRLNILVQDLGRKSELLKRNSHLGAGRDATVRRLKEAANLFRSIAGDGR